jgi:hypothetical protein
VTRFDAISPLWFFRGIVVLFLFSQSIVVWVGCMGLSTTPLSVSSWLQLINGKVPEHFAAQWLNLIAVSCLSAGWLVLPQWLQRRRAVLGAQLSPSPSPAWVRVLFPPFLARLAFYELAITCALVATRLVESRESLLFVGLASWIAALASFPSRQRLERWVLGVRPRHLNKQSPG